MNVALMLEVSHKIGENAFHPVSITVHPYKSIMTSL